MSSPPKGISPATRQAKREQAQTEALAKLEDEARKRRENSDRLRKLRLAAMKES